MGRKLDDMHTASTCGIIKILTGLLCLVTVAELRWTISALRRSLANGQKCYIHMSLHKHQQGDLSVFYTFTHTRSGAYCSIMQYCLNQSTHTHTQTHTHTRGVTVKHAIVILVMLPSACQRGCLLFWCQTRLSFTPAAS